MKVFTTVCLLLLVLSACSEPIRHPPGILVEHPPVQVNHTHSQHTFLHKDYLITKLADFDVTARVIRTRRYNSGKESDISPIDIAVGWGIMSDQTVLDQLKFKQYSRFLFYSWERTPPASYEVINRSSANIHAIPATRNIEQTLKRLRPGHIVNMKGYLVQANQERFRWRSSLTREDKGNGACEILFVEEVELLDPYDFYTYD